MEKTLDYRAAARLTGLPAGTLRALVCRGQIPHYRIRKRIVWFRPLRTPGREESARGNERPVDAAPDEGGSR